MMTVLRHWLCLALVLSPMLWDGEKEKKTKTHERRCATKQHTEYYHSFEAPASSGTAFLSHAVGWREITLKTQEHRYGNK